MLVNEADLVEASRRGEERAFNRLVETYQNQVYNLAYRTLGDPDSAADATQETFLSAFRHIKQYRGGSFRAWLLQIASSRCYDEFRRRGRTIAATSLNQVQEEAYFPEPRDPDPTPEQALMTGELQRHLQEALESLPFDQKLVVVLSDVQGMSYEEIAVATGAALGTVKSRLSRGRSSLRDWLSEKGELLPGRFRHG